MFGMSFGELCVLVIVGLVIFGPNDLPRVLRKAGQFVGKLRRIASDVRAESGIDEMLRSEGLKKDIAEIRRLARGDFSSPLVRTEKLMMRPPSSDVVVARHREYPREGADSHSAVPNAGQVHAQELRASRLDGDPLYLMKDASAAVPVPEPS